MDIKQSNPDAFKALNLGLKVLEKIQGKVGWFSTYNYPDGTPVAEVAAQNEFGNASKNIPPRPTVRPAAIDNKDKWARIANQGAKQVINGKTTAYDVMNKITLVAESDISKNIAKLTQPPLAARTIAERQARGNNSVKPLVDTGLEIATLTSVVENVT
jgi:hypothetical protein